MSEALQRDLMILARLFNEGGFKELRVDGGGTSVLLSQDRHTPSLHAANVAAAISPAATAPINATTVAAPVAANIVAPAPPSSGAADPSWIAVTAPNLGTFYRAPKPGMAPFVEVGQEVTAETEICLLEVMKLFTSVKAGVAGIIRQVCVADADLVEGGQTLFLIESH